jgi:hypothetical protein
LLMLLRFLARVSPVSVHTGLICVGQFSPSGFWSLHQDPVPLEFFFVQVAFWSTAVLATTSYFSICEPELSSVPDPWLASICFRSRVRSSLLAAYVLVLQPLVFGSCPKHHLHRFSPPPCILL